MGDFVKIEISTPHHKLESTNIQMTTCIICLLTTAEEGTTAGEVMRMRCNIVRVHPYTYGQHGEVLNQFLNIKYGCWKQSAVDYSLNHEHDIMH